VFDNLSCTPAQRSQAWAVHVFTTLGIVVAMLALRAVLQDRPGEAILWLLLTLVIDGVDGPVARALVVKERVPRIDGYVLDLIIDYVTCVIVPAAFMYQFKLVPNDVFGLILIGWVVFTAAIWFSRVDMMDEDNWFHGFPAAWNLVAPVLYLLHARTGVGASVTLVLSFASLSNIRVPHVMRAHYLRWLTLPITIVWIAAMAVGAFLDPRHPWVLRPFLALGGDYFILLAIWQTIRTVRRRRRSADSDSAPSVADQALPEVPHQPGSAMRVVHDVGKGVDE
jgi:phosphatidylcholine synthase